MSRFPGASTLATTCGRAPLGRFGGCLLAVTVAVAVTTSPSQAQTPPAPSGSGGAIGLRLLDAPVAARDDPRARVYIVDHLAPGAVIQRRIEVSNSTATTQHVVLYAAAATITDGAFAGAAGHTANELSTWTSVDPGESDVASNGKQTATVTIKVPGDAAPGEQYGVVWAEARSDAATSGGVAQVSRVGIRLYVSVGPGGPPAADFTIDTLTAGRSPEGQPTISTAVHNRGGRALDMSGTLQLSAGPGGLSAGPFPAKLGRTLGVGDTQTVTMAMDDQLPAGPWNALITLKSGLTERTGQASLTFPSEGAGTPVQTRAPGSGLGQLLPIAGGLTVLALLGSAGVVRVRHRRRKAAPTF